MRRPALLVVLTLALTGCGAEEEPPRPKAPVLELTAGSAVTLQGAVATGRVSSATPVSVAFESIECAEVLPERGLSEDSADIVDLPAAPGQQACLVELKVTNTGPTPNLFGSHATSKLRTSDGTLYGETGQNYSNQAIAASKGRHASDTLDLIQPGKTKWDYVIYEIPLDAQPEALVYDAGLAP